MRNCPLFTTIAATINLEMTPTVCPTGDDDARLSQQGGGRSTEYTGCKRCLKVRHIVRLYIGRAQSASHNSRLHITAVSKQGMYISL